MLNIACKGGTNDYNRAMTGQNMARARDLRWGCSLGVLAVVAIVVIGGGWFLLTRPPADPAGPRPTAVLWTATPTLTAPPLPTPTVPPVPPGQLGRGIRVQVSGTGSAGLSLRESPGTGTERIDVAADGESFLVVAGPEEANGYTWWLLRDESDPQREGWAAEAYLTPVD